MIYVPVSSYHLERIKSLMIILGEIPDDEGEDYESDFLNTIDEYLKTFGMDAMEFLRPDKRFLHEQVAKGNCAISVEINELIDHMAHVLIILKNWIHSVKLPVENLSSCMIGNNYIGFKYFERGESDGDEEFVFLRS